MKLRLAWAVVAVLGLVGGSLLPGADEAGASRFKLFVVEVSEAGFNPSVCKISRDNYVAFKNVGRAPLRVVHQEGTALFDSGMLTPGETSDAAFFPHGGTADFHDFARPNVTFTVLLPVWSPEWDESCAVNPALTPPPAFDCTPKVNCAVLPALSADG